MRCCCGCIRGLSVSGSARGWRRHSPTCPRAQRGNRGLKGFVLGTFAETSATIIRENITQVMQNNEHLRWVVVTAAVLAVPALAMAFNLGVPDPGSGTDGVN